MASLLHTAKPVRPTAQAVKVNGSPLATGAALGTMVTRVVQLLATARQMILTVKRAKEDGKSTDPLLS